MDVFDKKIILAVSRDARITLSALAEEVGLSKSPCHSRLKRLEREGVIRGYHAALDHSKMGAAHIAFVQVKLSDTRAAALEAFSAATLVVAEIEQCHMIAGSFDYFLKVRTSDIESYREVLGEKISALPHIASTSTFVSMQAVKE